MGKKASTEVELAVEEATKQVKGFFQQVQKEAEAELKADFKAAQALGKTLSISSAEAQERIYKRARLKLKALEAEERKLDRKLAKFDG